MSLFTRDSRTTKIVALRDVSCVDAVCTDTTSRRIEGIKCSVRCPYFSRPSKEAHCSFYDEALVSIPSGAPPARCLSCYTDQRRPRTDANTVRHRIRAIEEYCLPNCLYFIEPKGGPARPARCDLFNAYMATRATKRNRFSYVRCLACKTEAVDGVVRKIKEPSMPPRVLEDDLNIRLAGSVSSVTVQEDGNDDEVRVVPVLALDLED